jgi:hypothetical protein
VGTRKVFGVFSADRWLRGITACQEIRVKPEIFDRMLINLWSIKLINDLIMTCYCVKVKLCESEWSSFCWDHKPWHWPMIRVAYPILDNRTRPDGRADVSSGDTLVRISWLRSFVTFRSISRDSNNFMSRSRLYFNSWSWISVLDFSCYLPATILIFC